MKIYRLLIVAVLAQTAVLRPLPAAAQDTTASEFVFNRNHYGAAKEDPGRFTVNPASVRIELLGEVEETDMSYVKLAETSRPLEGVLNAIDTIVNIGQKIWKIVQDNKPVANISSKYAVAYPEGVTAAAQLSNWSRPKGYRYGFYAENLYGGVMIDCEYKVLFTYGGNYKGKGKFITAAVVIPTVADVAWGYKFSMDAAVPDSTITNIGTAADPVAAMQLKLAWKMATVLKESNGTSIYYMQGDGYYQEIASPWKDGGVDQPALRPVRAEQPPFMEPQALPFGLAQDNISQIVW